MIPRHGSRDENEPEIVEALEASGWSVHKNNAKGFPDLTVSKGSTTYLIEVVGDAKEKKYRSTSGLTPDQVKFHHKWRGTIYTVRSVEEALRVVNPRRPRY